MRSLNGIPILIPAYQPGEALLKLAGDLLRLSERSLIVVNDGSDAARAPIFEALAALPRVQVIHHAINQGKGAAIKTGLRHVSAGLGVVTADADGQHHPEDILRVAARLEAEPGALVLGVRDFSGDVPLRSRIGNGLTRTLMRFVIGQRLSDTQTGLRGIPAPLIPSLLRLPSKGYEFELDMLLACRHQAIPVIQEPIRTIYLAGNQSSHFRPVFDSMRIYFLLFRFTVLSLLTAAVDNLIFMAALSATGSIGRSQFAGRVVAMIFNYVCARRAVFHSEHSHASVLPKYVALVAVNGLLSYGLIQALHGDLRVETVPAKLLAEGMLFLVNFLVQRDFIFTRRNPGGATDWDRYYTSVPPTARLTRRYTTRTLLDAIKRYAAGSKLSVVEIGGANSCFVDSILGAFPCARYDVVDTNRYGLSLLAGHAEGGIVHLHEKNVLGLKLDREADLVFSVGLVEHFDPEHTRKAVHAHFDVLRPGGTAIVTFPTPTLLYRLTRGFLEGIGMWKFPDERPLDPEEVIAAIGSRGEILYRKTLWPLMLTQHLIVARKRHS